MGWLDKVADLVYPGDEAIPDAVAAQWPAWEVQSPQYPQPSAYTLMEEGYRKNELVYALINKRMVAVSEPPIKEYKKGVAEGDKRHVVDSEVDDSDVVGLLDNPNPFMSGLMFRMVTQLYMDYAGFSAWEIEFSNGGDPMGLWPMTPHFCSFLRGKGKAIRAIRYQPYGLPFQDVPIEKILLFEDYDPKYPMLKGFSRTAAALRIIGVDNKATDFLYEFFQHGAISYGLLSTEQSLTNATAEALRKRWHETHGGASNWSNVAVLGNGSKYQNLSLNFKEMAFDALDGRTEARLCMLYDTPAIILGAKVGLAASTYNNYQNARQAWYEEVIQPRWSWLSAESNRQLLPLYRKPEDVRKRLYYLGHDASKVKALQEDRTARWNRAGAAAKGNLITRDEAREEMGLDPIDNGEPVFVGVTVKGMDSNLDVTQIEGGDVEQQTSDAQGAKVQAAAQALVAGQQPANPALNAPAAPPAQIAAPAKPAAGSSAAPATTPAADSTAAAAKEAEAKQFRAYAKARMRERHPERIGNFQFHYHSDAEAKGMVLAELNRPAQQVIPAGQPASDPLLQAVLQLAGEMKATREALQEA